jgi:L-aspartate oxidase
MDRDIIPVSPAAHYTCGGITVDLDGASTLPGLYAIGECSCTGVHGANRLASNSTLECLVWSHRAWEKIREEGLSTRVEVEDIHGRKPREANYSPILASLRDMMWRDAGILRSEESLKRGHARLEALQGAFEDAPAGAPGHTELRNMLDAARLVLNAAYTRSESRGTHYMADHPDRDDAHWLQHVAICGEAIQKARHID